MTVTYDITTDVGKVRLKIGDTVLADYKFTDEEIEVFLSMESNNIDMAAALALESWAASYATNADSEKIGDYAYTQKVVDKMLALAGRLRSNVSGTPAFAISEMDLTHGSSITAEED